MKVMEKIFGPKSKYDKSLPYTYMARVNEIEGDDDVVSHYFSDTICGLVEFLDEHDIAPDKVHLFGILQKKETELSTENCISKDGKWLKRPDICKSLEAQYRNTLDDRYKGHLADHECSFEDRDREGSGPY